MNYIRIQPIIQLFTSEFVKKNVRYGRVPFSWHCTAIDIIQILHLEYKIVHSTDAKVFVTPRAWVTGFAPNSAKKNVFPVQNIGVLEVVQPNKLELEEEVRTWRDNT